MSLMELKGYTLFDRVPGCSSDLSQHHGMLSPGKVGAYTH